MYRVCLRHLIHVCLFQESTCKCRRVSEGSHLRVSETRQQRDDVVHHVLIIDDAVLALTHQHLQKHVHNEPINSGVSKCQNCNIHWSDTKCQTDQSCT